MTARLPLPPHAARVATALADLWIVQQRHEDDPSDASFEAVQVAQDALDDARAVARSVADRDAAAVADGRVA